jgi:hypothetical protein
VSERVGARIVAALGEPGARELLGILERSDADRAALIGRLYVREDARWLAEPLIDLEDDVGEIARAPVRRPPTCTTSVVAASHTRTL